jgi:hypothetical protein
MDTFLTVLGWFLVVLGLYGIYESITKIPVIRDMERFGNKNQVNVMIWTRIIWIVGFLGFGLWLAVFR